jgi:NADH dehydrogenase, FAD-containing subunit
MTRVVVLGGGIAGHTAAAFARRWLGRDDTVTVVSPRDHYNWVPSNIWVGVGIVRPEKVVFPLRPVYERLWRFAVINLKMIGVIRRSHHRNRVP